MTMSIFYRFTLAAIAIGAILGLLFSSCGCATLPEGDSWGAIIRDGYDTVRDIYKWDRAQKGRAKAEASQPTTPEPTPPTSPEPTPSTQDYADYSSFQWRYGGENFSSAAHTGAVAITFKGLSANRIDYSWDRDLSNWGIKDPKAADAVVCAFIQDSTGNWIGGKTDWVSTSRKSRDFNNVYNGYKGWSLSGIPNPTQLALVIVRRDGKERSNVIGGEWRR